MKALSLLVHGMDRILNIAVGLCLVLALLYGGYALWDTWQVYQGAAVDSALLSYQPDGENNRASFGELRAINPDVCAWISIDNTRINYPVLQGETNYEYLNQNIYGDFELAGSIFLDCQNSPDFTDRYSIIYGHHMDGGAMFGDLDLFRSQSFFDENTTGWLYLPERTYRLHIFAYMKVDAFNGPMYALLGSDAQLESLLGYIAENAVYDRTPQSGESVLALSTCSSAETNGRVLLLATMEEQTQITDDAA